MWGGSENGEIVVSRSVSRRFIHSFPKVTKLASLPLHLSNDPYLHNSTLESETKKIIISIDSQTKLHSCKIATERSCVPFSSFPYGNILQNYRQYNTTTRILRLTHEAWNGFITTRIPHVVLSHLHLLPFYPVPYLRP